RGHHPHGPGNEGPGRREVPALVGRGLARLQQPLGSRPGAGQHLAFFCGPGSEERIAELFAQSGLCRSKWKRDDYRKRTTAKALSGRTEFYKPGLRVFCNYTEEEPSRAGEGGDKDKPPPVKVGKPVVRIG